MSNRVRSPKEKIEDCLTNMVCNLEANLYEKLLNELLPISKINNNQVKIKKYVIKKLNIPSMGRMTKNYWLSRGWTEAESIFKSSQENIKSVSKAPRLSPFSIEFWEEKLNQKTGVNYTRDEAIFERNKRRPINAEYWMEKGYSEDESISLALSTKHENNIKGAKNISSQDKEILKSNSNRCVEYWLLRGYSVDEATKMISSIQSTFSLKKCVEKYGTEEGTQRWSDRQEKWLESMNNKTQEEKNRINKLKVAKGFSVSSFENELFDIFKSYDIDVSGQYMIRDTERKKRCVFDFRVGNKLIEFNGDFWHCNPILYDSSYFHPRMKKTAKEIWERDSERLKFAEDMGYEVLVVWEHDFCNDREKVIERCINFLTQ